MINILRFDWLLFILVGSGLVIWIRQELGLRPTIAVRPLAIANSHWLIAGIGSFLYPDRDSFGRFDLRLGVLPYALIATVILIWVVLLDWLFRRGGAELLASSSKALRSLNLPDSARGIQLMAVAAIGGGLLGLVALVLTATQMPR
jgi:hypothetical protein